MSILVLIYFLNEVSVFRWGFLLCANLHCLLLRQSKSLWTMHPTLHSSFQVPLIIFTGNKARSQVLALRGAVPYWSPAGLNDNRGTGRYYMYYWQTQFMKFGEAGNSVRWLGLKELNSGKSSWFWSTNVSRAYCYPTRLDLARDIVSFMHNYGKIPSFGPLARV